MNLIGETSSPLHLFLSHPAHIQFFIRPTTDNKEEAEKKFHDIAEAYEVLSDDELKAKYDRGEPVFENQGGGRQPFNPHQYFHQNFNGGGGGQQRFHFKMG